MKQRKTSKKETESKRKKGRKKEKKEEKRTIMSKVTQELISNRIGCQKNLRKWIDKKKNTKNM